MCSVKEFTVTAEFASLVSDLSAGDGNRLKRLSPDEISSLSSICDVTPSGFLSKVLSGCQGIPSGDVFVFHRIPENIQECYGFLTVRSGTDNNTGLTVMKTDTFVVDSDTTGSPETSGAACYHADCPNRYQNPIQYEMLRDTIPIGQFVEWSNQNLSAITGPIDYGIDSIHSFFSTN